jgi:rRNA processing protein Krr1/Pno1
VNADKDSEILKEIEKLVEVVKQTPNVQEKLAKYNITIKGSKVGAIGDHMNITGGIHIS